MTTKNHTTNVEPGTHPAGSSFSVEIQKNGPYNVKGFKNLHQLQIGQNDKGNSWEYVHIKNFPLNEKGTALCRCGQSQKKPYCDGAHSSSRVDLSETASFDPLLKNAEEIDGPELSLTDNDKYCSYARFCDNGLRVWEEVQHSGKNHSELVKYMVHRCPGGRLLAWDSQSGQPMEDKMEASVQIIEDPALGVSGPLAVWGGVSVKSSRGQDYEVRTRQALCRCGASSNKPFCDGTHASSQFNDGL